MADCECWLTTERLGLRHFTPADLDWPAELLNSDAEYFGGGNVGNQGGLWAEPIGAHGRPFSLSLTLPPLGGVILKKS